MTRQKQPQSTSIPREEQECEAFVQWLELKKLPFSHLRHETFTRSWTQKKKIKKLGVRKGVPDYMVVVKNTLVFIEMKRREKSLSNVAKSQREWNEILNDCEGVKAFICYGWEAAMMEIENILKN